MRWFSRTSPGAVGFRLLLAAGMTAMTAPAFAAEDAAKPSAPPATATAESPPIDPAVLLGAQVRLGNTLIGKLAAGKSAGANVVVSPASLAVVFALLDMGANDDMRQAIHRTLGFDGAKDTAHDTAAHDLAGTRATATSIMRRAAAEGPLALANIVVFDPASQPLQPAMERLRTAGATVAVEDLAKPETVTHINTWVKEQTRGLIPTVLEEPPARGGLVAVNALYFKDRWKTPFDPAATRDRPFHVSVDKTLDVPMMRSEGHFAFRQDDKFVAVQLAYTSDYELVVVTSKDAPLGVGEFAGAADWLGGQGFSQSDGEVVLPRFSASGSEQLLGALDALGLAEARQSPDALKGFAAAPQVIAQVMQKTELRINEEGTEAAAATAVITTRSAAPLPAGYVNMTVDKPFVFALRDKTTGLVMLQGYVAEPAKN